MKKHTEKKDIEPDIQDVESNDKEDITEEDLKELSDANTFVSGVTIKWPKEYCRKIEKEELISLLEKYKHGSKEEQKEIKTIIVGGFQRLVLFAIHRWYHQFCPLYAQDLYQEGCLSIQENMLKYKEDIAPSTYFAKTIKHSLQVYVAKTVYGTSRHYASAATKIKKAEEELCQIDGNAVHSDILVSQIAGLPLTTVIEARKHLSAKEHVDFGAVNESELNEGTSPEDELLAGELSSAIQKSLSRLSKEEKTIMTMLYGFDNGNIKTANEVARILSTTAEKVRITAQEAQRKLSHDKNLAAFVGYSAKKTRKPTPDMPFAPVLRSTAEGFFDYEK